MSDNDKTEKNQVVFLNPGYNKPANDEVLGGKDGKGEQDTPAQTIVEEISENTEMPIIEEMVEPIAELNTDHQMLHQTQNFQDAASAYAAGMVDPRFPTQPQTASQMVQSRYAPAFEMLNKERERLSKILTDEPGTINAKTAEVSMKSLEQHHQDLYNKMTELSFKAQQIDRAKAERMANAANPAAKMSGRPTINLPSFSRNPEAKLIKQASKAAEAFRFNYRKEATEINKFADGIVDTTRLSAYVRGVSQNVTQAIFSDPNAAPLIAQMQELKKTHNISDVEVGEYLTGAKAVPAKMANDVGDLRAAFQGVATKGPIADKIAPLLNDMQAGLGHTKHFQTKMVDGYEKLAKSCDKYGVDFDAVKAGEDMKQAIDPLKDAFDPSDPQKIENERKAMEKMIKEMIEAVVRMIKKMFGMGQSTGGQKAEEELTPGM